MTDSFFSKFDYTEILLDEYERRNLRRPSYSLRAFARDLGLEPQTLNDVLKKKYGLSGKKAKLVAERLKFTPRQADFFCDLVLGQHARSKAGRMAAKARLALHLKKIEFELIQAEHHHVLTNWKLLAIRQTLELKSVPKTVSGIAKALNRTEAEIYFELNQLEKLGYVRRQGEQYFNIKSYTQIESPVPSEKIRGFHKQILDLANEALENQTMKERSARSTIFTIAQSDLKEAQAWIDQRNLEFIEKFATTTEGTDVYALSLQLFRITSHADF